MIADQQGSNNRIYQSNGSGKQLIILLPLQAGILIYFLIHLHIFKVFKISYSISRTWIIRLRRGPIVLTQNTSGYELWYVRIAVHPQNAVNLAFTETSSLIYLVILPARWRKALWLILLLDRVRSIVISISRSWSLIPVRRSCLFFIRAGVPPKLTSTVGLFAVISSNTHSSYSWNQNGMRKRRSGISAIMSTGKPIAAMVCEMATVQETPRICRPMKRIILLRGTVLRGSWGERKRRSEFKYQNFFKIPLDSMEPHCDEISKTSDTVREEYSRIRRYIPQQQRKLRQTLLQA